MSIISVSEFANNYHSDYRFFERVIKEDEIKDTFISREGMYYAEDFILYELFINNIFAPPDNYISLPQYAKTHNIDAQRFRKLVKKGWLKTAALYRGRWYIDKNEKIAVSNTLFIRKQNHELFLKNLDMVEGKITAKEYADLHNVTEKEIITLVKEGLLHAYVPAKGHFYFDRNEPFVPYVNIMQYARLHKLTYAKVYSAVINGQLKSAVRANRKWFLLPTDTGDFE